MYIVLEGIVGSGKTTQVKKLVEYFTSSPNPFSFREGGKTYKSPLLQERARVRCVREPGTTPIAEDIRYLAQAKEWQDETMHPLTNAYLYTAARAQTLQTIVYPALDRGDIVISDRSFLSSCVIQGEAQGIGIDTILDINQAALSGILPDYILYLDIDIDLALSRIFDEGGDKFEKEGRDFYQAIIRGYEKCEKLEFLKNRFIRIDANGGEEEVFERILQELKIHN